MYQRIANWLAVFRNPAARMYLLVGLAALGVLLFALLQKESAFGALCALLFGGLGLLTRWRPLPLMVLFVSALGIVHWWQMGTPPREPAFDLGNLLVIAGLIAYLAAQYRLYGFTENVLPPEMGSPNRKSIGRPAEAVRDRELFGLAIVAAAAAVATQVIWALLPDDLPSIWTPPKLIRLAGLCLLLGGGGLIVAALWRHFALRRADATTAQLVMQDVLWAETRREQRRIHRWRAWALRRWKSKTTKEEAL